MKTLIVGNGTETLSVIERIYDTDKNAEVTLLAVEGVLPYDRTLLPALVTGISTEKSLHRSFESFALTYHPEIMTTEVLARISVKRKYVTTESKKQIHYDRLIVMDTGHCILPSFKGYQKKGVFDCWRIASIKALKKYLLYADTLMVVVSNFQGLNIACALKQLKKDVTVIVQDAVFLSAFFDEETGRFIKQMLEAQGMRVLNATAIDEILGDVEVKAIRLKSGKVLACDAVVVDEISPDLRVLSESELSNDDKFLLEEHFKPIVMPLASIHFGFENFHGFCVGYTRLPNEGREYLKFDSSHNIYKKIYVQGDHLVGCVSINASIPDNQRLMEIHQRQENVTGKEEEIF